MSKKSSTFALAYVKARSASAISHTAIDTKTVKVIRNGQVLILRDGKIFNALGVEIRD